MNRRPSSTNQLRRSRLAFWLEMGAMNSTLPDSHRADVQGLRALAVLLVLIYHAGLPLSGGYVGVDVFFVISGYVIVGSLLRSWQEGNFSLISFYLRRVRRLLPAFSLLVITTLLLSLLFTTYDARTQAFETARAGALFAANLQLMLFRPNSYFTSSEQANPLLHTWSLSVEEQIYFVIPFAFFILWKITRGSFRTRKAALALLMVLLLIISLLASYSFTYARAIWPFDNHGHLARGLEASMMIAFYSPFTRVWEFLLGAIVAVSGFRVRGIKGRVLLAIGAIAIIGSAIVFDASTAFPGLLAGIPVLGTATMLIGSDFRLGKFSVLESRVAGWIGDRSYSIYLWHWPLIQFAKALYPDLPWSPLVGAVISLPLASLAFRFVETPIRHSTLLATKKQLGALVLAGCVGLVFSMASFEAIEPTPELQVHEDVTSGCVEESFDAILSRSTCVWPLPGATRDAILIGDSQAGQITEAFITAAHSNGLNARVVTRTGEFMLNPDRDYVAQLVSQSKTIDVVVVGQLTFDGDRFGEWEPLIQGFLRTITENSKKVVFLHRINKGGEPLKCATVRLMLVEHACELPANESLASRDYVRKMLINESAVIGKLEGVFGFDPNPYLCRSYPCRSQQEEGWLWRDPSHLSRRAADRLTEPLAQTMERALSNF